MKSFLKWYWMYIYNMEVERAHNLDALYHRERAQISEAKRKALHKLHELGVEQTVS